MSPEPRPTLSFYSDMPEGNIGRSHNTNVDVTFDPNLRGKVVEADGGTTLEVNSNFASRASFKGTLTGRRLRQGDPPWNWLEIGNLTLKPDDFKEEFVWCEESYIYDID